MYAEIFKNGITEESLNIACDYAKSIIQDGIEFRENFRRTVEFYHCTGVMFVDESKGMPLYETIKESLKVNTIVIPPNKESYYAKKYVKDWIISDEAGQWKFPIPIENEPVSYSDKEIAAAMAFRAGRYVVGTDPYKEE